MLGRKGEEGTETRTDTGRFPYADGMYFHVFSPCLTAVAEERAGNVVHFQPMSSPAAARTSTFNPCRTLRRREAPLSTHIEQSGCTAPIFVRRPSSASVPSLLSGPYRASRGSSLGATVATPLGMGWALGTDISPRGPPWVARGEVPKVLDCSTTASFWMPFRYPFLGRNLHTVVQKIFKRSTQKLS